MHAQIITTCTNRKLTPVPHKLDMASLDKVDQASLLNIWTNNIRSIKDMNPAIETYCGRGFQEAVHTASVLNSSLQIISAGLGMVEGRKMIPAYNATLVRSSPASVHRKITGSFDPSRWWLELNQENGDRPLISDFVRDHPNELVIITLSWQYIDLLKSDLLLLKKNDISRIRIIGPRSPKLLPERLRRCLMPYDERFDGPLGPCRGTRSDFPQRATRHFVEEILFHTPDASCECHSKQVSAFLDPLPNPRIIKRIQITDDGIIDEIQKNWREACGSSARMLRLFRDEKMIACEQGRFARLFKQVKMERNRK